MSAELKKESKSDWDLDDEDENWDDWGDAEENFDDNKTEQTDKPNTVATTTTKISNNEHVTKAENTGVVTGNHESLQDATEFKNDNQPQNVSSWGIWGSKLTSVLSTATEGLGNITNTVSQGLNQVIGVPDPEDMARINAAEAAKLREQVTNQPPTPVEESKSESDDNSGVPVFGLNLVSGVTTLGSKVLNTGLDTLEGIGKKTMDLLQENDPLLKNKRKLLGIETEKPNLSEVLKEAKKDAETLENTLKELNLEKTKAALCFELLFENYCGLVHLEAIEILSKESTLKLEKLIEAVSGNALAELKETLDEVKELTELEEIEGESDGHYDAKELNERLSAAIADVELPIKFDDIADNWEQTLLWLKEESLNADEQSVFGKGLTALAETCALSMSKLHKMAELLLVKEHHSTANEVDAIVQLCKHVNTHLSGLTTRYAAILTARESDEAKAHVTKLFAEQLLAMQNIEKAFKLFLPILQIGAV